LVPAIVNEAGSDLVDGWLKTDDAICTWGLTRVELASAIERRAREGALTAGQRRAALKLVVELATAATEVLDLQAVRERGVPLVCLDRRLADAASREGFDVLGWPDG
jgi:hypothetical protein